MPVDPNSWLKDKDQQPHSCTHGTIEPSNMQLTNHVAIMAVLSANLIVASPAYAAGEEATHEARIHELEETVSERRPCLSNRPARLTQRVRAWSKSRMQWRHPRYHPSTCGETTIRAGGFAKLDAIVSDYSKAPTRGIGEDFFIPSSIRMSGDSGDPHRNLHAKETRFRLKSKMLSRHGCLKRSMSV